MNFGKPLLLATTGLLLAATYSFSVAQGTSAMPSDSHGKAASSSSSQLSASDKKFMETAARDGQAEVELGKLAVSKASSPDVKNFAQTMVDDHSKANEQLQQIAKSKGVTLPSKPDSAHEKTLKNLQNASGAEFDKRYMAEAGMKDHRSAQKLFEDQVKKGQDPDLKAFAEKTLPVINHHAEMVQNMAGTNQKK